MLVLDYNWHPGPPSPGVPLVPPIEGCNQPTIAEGQCVAGFGGYQWDLALFPDPVAFQRWVHNRSGADLQLVLNIHDQCGIDSCQFNYAAAAHAAGIDPSSRAPVPCGFLQKSYAESLTAGMLEADPHHALTDFWWEDYGLGGPGIGKYQVLCTANDSSKSSFGHCLHCYQDDVDAKPQLWSAYVHGSRREMKNLRSLTLGIYGGLGHHRYPGVGSGDVYASWGTLQFEIFLSVTAANVVTEWNHDLGGFMETADSRIGRFDPLLNATTWLHPPERYLRWLQAGVFQPIFRTHMSNPGDPSPWEYPNFGLLRQAYLLRNSLVPYIYSASYDAYLTGVLPMHPLYYDFGAHDPAYELSSLDSGGSLEYCFGDAFVVSPISVASNASDGAVRRRMWVPPGGWVDYFAGSLHTGPCWIERSYLPNEIPLLVKAGSVVPMKSLADSKNLAPKRLILSGQWAMLSEPSESSTRVYEDDGESLDYQGGGKSAFRLTHATMSIGHHETEMAVLGDPTPEGIELEATRRFEVRFVGAPVGARVHGCRWQGGGPMAGVEWRRSSQEITGLDMLVGLTPVVNASSGFACGFQHS
eukprot:TRINITY_DN29705_c0_g1_i2.p1 TRINITY_DN29705_c0_g1~~TRINITY_DN29705_c0_g1_i2.p1  ORF type:complete len:584 (+),score=96.53 TRINITY_DN29705_c0_g1_i2:393-2144(+)